MSNSTWQIVSKQEFGHETFELSVTAESEHRPGIVYRWRGKIEIDESGGQHLKNMFLDGAGSADKGAALPKMDVHTWITRGDDPAAAFENVAGAYDEDTQRMEKSFLEREEKERRDRESVGATTLCLKQLADEGIHPGAGLTRVCKG